MSLVAYTISIYILDLKCVLHLKPYRLRMREFVINSGVCVIAALEERSRLRNSGKLIY